MNKLVAAIVASAFALGSAAGFAAETAKKIDLTKEERMELRARADRLTAERARGVSQPVAMQQAPKSVVHKKHHVRKSHKVAHHKAKRVQP